MDTVTYHVPIDPDADGYVGRECPACEKYFKVVPGTGIVADIPCICPYCGTSAPPNHFWTKDQIEYAQSVAVSQLTGELIQGLKKLERKPDPRAFFSLGFEVKGQPFPVAYYREADLEQRLTCDVCTLQYSIYGVFGFCPDCGTHNSLQVLEGNLALADQILALAETMGKEIGGKLAESALSDCIAAFDGFGRELVRAHSTIATGPQKGGDVSFQNIARATEVVRERFGVDLAASLEPGEFADVSRAFQKRHLLAHRMGVADQQYVERSGESADVLGRRLTVSVSDVRALANALLRMARHLSSSLAELTPSRT